MRSSLTLYALLLVIGGCSTDDHSRPGTWRPNGANETNLRAMIADPTHLRAGVAAPTERAAPASLAIRRMNADRRKPLPDSRIVQFGGSGGGAPSAAPNTPGGTANAP